MNDRKEQTEQYSRKQLFDLLYLETSINNMVVALIVVAIITKTLISYFVFDVTMQSND